VYFSSNVIDWQLGFVTIYVNFDLVKQYHHIIVSTIIQHYLTYYLYINTLKLFMIIYYNLDVFVLLFAFPNIQIIYVMKFPCTMYYIIIMQYLRVFNKFPGRFQRCMKYSGGELCASVEVSEKT